MLFANDPNQDWDTWGKVDPYFGVISEPQFLNKNLNDDSIRDFFDSGVRHVEHIYSVIRTNIQPNFQPAKVLDYGCGVGRLVIPFAQRSPAIVGIDVSPTMLEHARENCDKFDATSALLLHVDKMDSLTPASFDLVHSFIVFQHIPVARGELILRKLISLIAEGGVGAIHFTYADDRSRLRHTTTAVRKHSDFAHRLLNLVQRRPLSTPLVQMNNYSMNRIFDILADEHCSNLHVEFSVHGLHHGAMLYFEKSPRAFL